VDALKAQDRNCAAADEWCAFDEKSALIKNDSRRYAAPAVKDIPIGELVEFDYKGDCHLSHE
jgi:hypothetical protein